MNRVPPYLPGHTVIPGLKAHERIVSDECREGDIMRRELDCSGLYVAVNEIPAELSVIQQVLGTVGAELHELFERNPRGKGIKFHVVVTVDNPENYTTKQGQI